MGDELWREDFPGEVDPEDFLVFQGALRLMSAKLQGNYTLGEYEVDQCVEAAERAWLKTKEVRRGGI